MRPVEFHILLSLATGERHGYGVIKDIEQRGETSVPDVSTMYRALARMLENGLIATGTRPALMPAANVATITASPRRACAWRGPKPNGSRR